MKKLLFICVGHLLLLGCKKETIDHTQIPGGGNNNNNHSWVAMISTEPLTDRDSLSIKTANNNSNEHLSVKVRFYGAGEYFPDKNEVRYTVLPNALYELDITKINVFEVDEFDQNNNMATGSFAASFIKTAGSSSFEQDVAFTDEQF